MKVLINSPLVKSHLISSKYQGIERLCMEFALELDRTGHKVSIIAPKDSEYPETIELIGTDYGSIKIEEPEYSKYSHRLSEFDVIHDFSHYHAPAVYNENLPVINIFWHDPYIAEFTEPYYNMAAISDWGAKRFQEVYKQDAISQEVVVVNKNKYYPGKIKSDRFMSLAIMLHIKGNLNVMRMCRKAGVGLDVCGGLSPMDPIEYRETVKTLCNGKIKYVGEVDDETKIKLLQESLALLYWPNIKEVHCHKLCEALACGTPVITRNSGANKEKIGNAGFVVDSEDEFVKSIHKAKDFDTNLCIERAKVWDVETVVGNYVKLYEEVADGKRW